MTMSRRRAQALRQRSRRRGPDGVRARREAAGGPRRGPAPVEEGARARPYRRHPDLVRGRRRVARSCSSSSCRWKRELQCTLPFDLFQATCPWTTSWPASRPRPRPRSAAPPDARKRTVFLLPGIGGDEPLLAGFRQDSARAGPLRGAVLPRPFGSRPARLHLRPDRRRRLRADRGRIPGQGGAARGLSFGGLVAYAAASRLHETGWRVRFLGILDTNLQLGRAEASRHSLRPAQRARQIISVIKSRGVFSGLVFKVVLRPRLRPLVGGLAGIWRPPVESSFSIRYRQKAIFFLRWDAALRWLQRLEPVPLPDIRSRVPVRGISRRRDRRHGMGRPLAPAHGVSGARRPPFDVPPYRRGDARPAVLQCSDGRRTRAVGGWRDRTGPGRGRRTSTASRGLNGAAPAKRAAAPQP